MSEPSRPHRRLSIAVPTGAVAVLATTRAALAESASVAADVDDAAPPTRPFPSRIAGGSQPHRRLLLTSPSSPEPLGLPPDNLLPSRWSPGTVGVLPAGGGPAPEVPPSAGARRSCSHRPRRHLLLTSPTLGSAEPMPVDDDLPLYDFKEAIYLLPRSVLQSLEGVWLERQAAGEPWSKSDLVAAMLSGALADPHLLSDFVMRFARLAAGESA